MWRTVGLCTRGCPTTGAPPSCDRDCGCIWLAAAATTTIRLCVCRARVKKATSATNRTAGRAAAAAAACAVSEVGGTSVAAVARELHRLSQPNHSKPYEFNHDDQITVGEVVFSCLP